MCSDQAPEKAPANFHLYRKGDVAELYWTPDGANPGDKVSVCYKQVSSNDWQYSVQVANTGFARIEGLGNLDITFGIQQVNGCSAGSLASPMSNIVVDGNTTGWVLFQ